MRPLGVLMGGLKCTLTNKQHILNHLDKTRCNQNLPTQSTRLEVSHKRFLHSLYLKKYTIALLSVLVDKSGKLREKYNKI